VPASQEACAALVRESDDLRAHFNGEAGEGVMPMREAMNTSGVSRQTVLQRVNRGKLEAVHITRGKQKGLLIKSLDQQPGLFDPSS
jgi:hypothetical protein